MEDKLVVSRSYRRKQDGREVSARAQLFQDKVPGVWRILGWRETNVKQGYMGTVRDL